VLVRPRFPRTVARIALSAALVATGTYSSDARAGEKEDNATLAAVEKVMSTDVPNANFGDAKKKLRALIDKCKNKCSGPVVARVYVAIGMVAAQINQTEEAKTAWSDALTVDPSASLPQTGVSPAIRAQFDETKKQWLAAHPQPDDAEKSGWVNKSAYELAKAAIAAEQAKNFADCIEKDKSALTLEENMSARMHLALCEAQAGKIVDALRDNAKALEAARAKGDAASAKTIQERVTALLPKLAHVRFERPVEVTELQITFDDRPIPEARLGESFTIDPGTHVVHAEGLLRGARVSSDEKLEVKEGETAVVKIKLKPVALTKGQLECMVSARTQEEILACLPQDRKPILVHAALDVSGYTDTVNVHVLTPAVRGSVSSPTGGWNVGANYLVDVVTAASPDIVSTASRRFHDVRHVVGLTGGYKPGTFGAQAYANYSEERDYISRTLGLSLSGDLMEKQVTPTLGYAYTWDTIGRTGTPYDVFGKPFDIHQITAASTFVLGPTSVLVAGGGVALENGDQSKPYRYVPLFEPGVSVPIGASVDEVNRARLPAKPLEQLPLDRQRFNVSGRYVSRIRSNATLRLEERLYYDTWAIMATTTDARYMVDVSPRFRVWPHLHVHVQSGAQFYRRVYGATLNPDGSANIPEFRTTDRELSPMFGVTGGGGVRYALTDPGGKFQLAVFSTADVLFNYYINTLFIRTRFAGYGTIGIEADFE
jgi:tetratricopeptide (TPR) repeat protein